jgi:DNA polymerase-3 subunit alpha/error-prone DNA polymerase
MMMSFAGYSFCKPHSASFARVSFQSAYIKTHFPAEFIAAVISNQGGFYGTFAYVSEARRMGLKILPPDVNQSDIRWKGSDKAIRTGFLSISNLSTNTQQRIIEKRQATPYRNLRDFLERVEKRKARPYRNLIDFLEWVRPEEPEARSLIHAGAFDSLHQQENRATLLWELAAWQKSRTARSRKTDLFDNEFLPTIAKPSFPPQNERLRLRHEFAALGFLCDRHPMVLYNGVGALQRCIRKSRHRQSQGFKAFYR